jgi:hypothetical protein
MRNDGPGQVMTLILILLLHSEALVNQHYGKAGKMEQHQVMIISAKRMKRL